MKKQITILVNQRPHKVEQSTLTREEIVQLAGAPTDYEVWKIIGKPDPEGQLPQDDLQVTSSIEVKDGDRFRVVPTGTFGATTFEEEVVALKEFYPQLEVREANGFMNIIFPAYELPPKKFNKQESSLLIEIPQSYPNGKPDMFWLDEDVRLSDGSIPKSAEETKNHFGDKNWRRFSWHLSKWDPTKDSLFTYIGFVDQRLSQAV